MPVELEKKYLLASDEWEHYVNRTVYIVQGYIYGTSPYVRIRRSCNVNQCSELFCQDCDFGMALSGTAEHTLTIKKIANKEQLDVREEFNIPISPKVGEPLLAMAKEPLISKQRSFVKYDQYTWTIDEFHRENAGLIVAEVEATKGMDREVFAKEINENLPSWVGKDITDDEKYINSSLVNFPFTHWMR